jgi:hypothetical protein
MGRVLCWSNLKFIKGRRSPVHQPALGLGGFLRWVFVFPSIGRPHSLAFIRSVACRGIDADESNAYGLSARSAKFLDLPDQIANDSINLFDHSLRENLRLCANLDIRDFTSCHEQPGFSHGYCRRHQLPEFAITTATRSADRRLARLTTRSCACTRETSLVEQFSATKSS